MFIYGFSDLCQSLSEFDKNAEVFSIGKSVCGRDIFCIKFGNGRKKVFLNGSHHGAESITSALLVRLATKACCDAEICKKSTVFIVPMVNPDGAELVKCGCEDFFNRDFLIKANSGSCDFSKWQANARGVDLNHNYDAGWELSKKLEMVYGTDKPGRTRFGGFFPHSEPETKALVNLTERERFDITVSYHTQGKVIYYAYPGITPHCVLDMGLKIADLTGYELSNPEGIASYGGYRDWFIRKFNKPGFTIEAGFGENPLQYSQLEDIYTDNEEIINIVAG